MASPHRQTPKKPAMYRIYLDIAPGSGDTVAWANEFACHAEQHGLTDNGNEKWLFSASYLPALKKLVKNYDGSYNPLYLYELIERRPTL